MLRISTRDQILNIAQALAQTRGFNAFSYADIAEELGIRNASIHHHFPSKLDLEAELLSRYRSVFVNELSNIRSEEAKSAGCLQRYTQLYFDTLKSHRVCLGGMMASDVGALPDVLAPSLNAFFEEQLEWLTSVLRTGKKNGELNYSGSAESQANLLLAALQGGLMITNATNDEAIFMSMSKTLLAQLK